VVWPAAAYQRPHHLLDYLPTPTRLQPLKPSSSTKMLHAPAKTHGTSSQSQLTRLQAAAVVRLPLMMAPASHSSSHQTRTAALFVRPTRGCQSITSAGLYNNTPWVVTYWADLASNSSGKWTRNHLLLSGCTGNQLAPYMVLTAAHCVDVQLKRKQEACKQMSLVRVVLCYGFDRKPGASRVCDQGVEAIGVSWHAYPETGSPHDQAVVFTKAPRPGPYFQVSGWFSCSSPGRPYGRSLGTGTASMTRLQWSSSSSSSYRFSSRFIAAKKRQVYLGAHKGTTRLGAQKGTVPSDGDSPVALGAWAGCGHITT